MEDLYFISAEVAFAVTVFGVRVPFLKRSRLSKVVIIGETDAYTRYDAAKQVIYSFAEHLIMHKNNKYVKFTVEETIILAFNLI